MRDFIVSDHASHHDAFLADMRRWLAGGAVRNRETVVDGLERRRPQACPEAFLGLFEGANIGKMIGPTPGTLSAASVRVVPRARCEST